MSLVTPAHDADFGGRVRLGVAGARVADKEDGVRVGVPEAGVGCFEWCVIGDLDVTGLESAAGHVALPIRRVRPGSRPRCSAPVVRESPSLTAAKQISSPSGAVSHRCEPRVRLRASVGTCRVPGPSGLSAVES